ncbi:MAG: TolB family protein [Candidatus Bathyarchaeia archaeon]
MKISEDILRIPLILGFDLSTDGSSIIYSSNESGVPHIYDINLSNPQESRQLTRGEDPVITGKISPKADSFVYSQDGDGNERHHLFLRPFEGSRRRKITDDAYRTYDFDWDPHGDEITGQSSQ